ncbi:MAG: DNA mismatch repair endonuclease MutL [Bacteroidales bacterium]|nr:DNA mismatch repair endonuclease MutL [Bacteroidales bacterium]
MTDVIKLLPDAVANQIAAGEVIQRPASAVKELLENAVDAGAQNIQLIIKDAGKTLIQVVDDGKGMSETDARLCFERHATSKIEQASDLFAIRTMGFRGEALASIAAIAKVELKTRTVDEQLGSEVVMEAARLISQSPCNCTKGTSVAVKNLFFNTPARRNFLKSDNIEKRHILTEFQRLAIAYPDIAFQFYQNNQLTHQLNKGNAKQRLIHLFGSNYNQRLIPVSEETQLVRIDGFVGKPQYARKVRGEQFLFVNKRYIRSAYLNHAVEQAFHDLIPEDAFPSFFLFLETSPEQIDVNVHPTKTEIKFQDERYIYQVVRSAVKMALASHNATPSLDFDRENSFDIPETQKYRKPSSPSIQINPDFNPFNQGREKSTGQPFGDLSSRINPKQWEKLFPTDADLPPIKEEASGKQVIISPDWNESLQDNGEKKFFQLHNQYILTPVKSGLMIIDQQRAHERILFEKYTILFENRHMASQQLLFPENVRLNEHESEILKEIIEDIKGIGFSINELSANHFVIDAIPVDLTEDDSLQEVIEGVIEQYQKNRLELKADSRTNVLRSMARKLAIKPGKMLTQEEMASIADSLFACKMPQQSPAGKTILSIISNEELAARFK